MGRNTQQNHTNSWSLAPEHPIYMPSNGLMNLTWTPSDVPVKSATMWCIENKAAAGSGPGEKPYHLATAGRWMLLEQHSFTLISITNLPLKHLLSS